MAPGRCRSRFDDSHLHISRGSPFSSESGTDMTTINTALGPARGVEVLDLSLPDSSRNRTLTMSAAEVPMGVLAWVVTRPLAHAFSGPTALPRSVLVCITTWLIRQCALVLLVVRGDQDTLRWPPVRDASWPHAASEPSTGLYRSRRWVVLIACLIFGAEDCMLGPAFVRGA